MAIFRFWLLLGRCFSFLFFVSTRLFSTDPKVPVTLKLSSILLLIPAVSFDSWSNYCRIVRNHLRSWYQFSTHSVLHNTSSQCSHLSLFACSELGPREASYFYRLFTEREVSTVLWAISAFVKRTASRTRKKGGSRYSDRTRDAQGKRRELCQHTGMKRGPAFWRKQRKWWCWERYNYLIKNVHKDYIM
jgi:hypothetical protein